MGYNYTFIILSLFQSNFRLADDPQFGHFFTEVRYFYYSLWQDYGLDLEEVNAEAEVY